MTDREALSDAHPGLAGFTDYYTNLSALASRVLAQDHRSAIDSLRLLREVVRDHERALDAADPWGSLVQWIDNEISAIAVRAVWPTPSTVGGVPAAPLPVNGPSMTPQGRDDASAPDRTTTT